MTQRNSLEFAFVQISNLSEISSTFPAITHDGLPFGDHETLRPPAAISGQIKGLPHPDNNVLAYFGLNAATGLWTSGRDWVASVHGGAYTATIPIASEYFAAVVMSKTFWSNFLAANGGGNTFTVSAVPTADVNVGDVLISTVFKPGGARAIHIGQHTQGQRKTANDVVIQPGYVYPMGPLFLPYFLSVSNKDTTPPGGYKTIDGKTQVKPGSLEFFRSMLTGLPFNDALPLQGSPHREAYSCAVVQANSLNASKPNGWLAFICYEDPNGDIYFVVAFAGPRVPLTINSEKIYSNDRKIDARFVYTGALAIFSDDVIFNVAQTSASSPPSGFGMLVKAVKTTGKKISKVLNSLV